VSTDSRIRVVINGVDLSGAVSSLEIDETPMDDAARRSVCDDLPDEEFVLEGVMTEQVAEVYQYGRDVCPSCGSEVKLYTDGTIMGHLVAGAAHRPPTLYAPPCEVSGWTVDDARDIVRDREVRPGFYSRPHP
jgi:hypothetical protein